MLPVLKMDAEEEDSSAVDGEYSGDLPRILWPLVSCTFCGLPLFDAVVCVKSVIVLSSVVRPTPVMDSVLIFLVPVMLLPLKVKFSSSTSAGL